MDLKKQNIDLLPDPIQLHLSVSRKITGQKKSTQAGIHTMPFPAALFTAKKVDTHQLPSS